MNAAVTLGRMAAANGWSRRTAYQVVGGREWTHSEVHDLAARAAGVLLARGLVPSSRLLIALPDDIGWVVTFLAAARIGAVAVPVNPALPPAEHATLIADSAPAFAVGAEELADRFDPRQWIAIEELLRAAATTPTAQALPAGDGGNLYIQYTSGSTGQPRGAVHRHGDLAWHQRAVGQHMLGIHPGDVSFSISKLYFAYGFGNSLIYPLHTGSSAVLLPQAPTPKLVAEIASRYRVTVLHGVPSAYAHLVAAAEPAAFSTLRAAVSAGERLSPVLGEQASGLLGVPVLDELGCTEVGGAFCANRVHRNVAGTIGFPLTGFSLDIRDATGQRLADGTTGELWVRGPTLLVEYFRRPRETASALRDGWLRTGDLALRNADGSYVHQGRIDDMQMVGGITVSPQEVEETLGAHPAVREIGVVAVPDESGATKLRAYFVPRARPADAAELATLEAELLNLARHRLAPYKVPRSATAVQALPRTATGKLRRFLLREQPPAAFPAATTATTATTAT